MRLPFTIEQFLNVFSAYNQAIWPAQIVAYVIGVVIVVLAIVRLRAADKLISSLLALMWIWTGAVYHIGFFRVINPIAMVFGILFIVQGLLLIIAGPARQQLRFGVPRGISGIFGGLFILYAMVIYPVLGYLFGHVYPHSPVFGVAPCPMAIFTFGMLLWTTARVPRHLLIISVLWAVLGLSAATQLGIREDLGLIVSALFAVLILLTRKEVDQQRQIEENSRETAETATL